MGHVRPILLSVGVWGLAAAASGCATPIHQLTYPAYTIRAQAPHEPKRLPPTVKKIAITDRVVFETNKALLLPKSLPVLDQVVGVLKENPQITQVEIQGHTDNTGTLDKNQALSQARAESVMKYLVQKGVSADRLVARGYGQTVPIASNDTPDGKATNRRVEFHILRTSAAAAAK